MHWAGVVKGTAKLWTKLCALVRQRRVQLALSFRATIAALASLALAQFLQLPLPLWAVLTALIVTQLSVGRSLKVTFDYLLGTLGGAIYAGAIGVLSHIRAKSRFLRFSPSPWRRLPSSPRSTPDFPPRRSRP
jgi:hypothetical protein